ncbi:AMP-binding protein, partial [Acinetobacter baumannii]
LSHLNIVHSLLHFQHCMGIAPGDRLLLAVPASHVTGLIALILAAVQGQACLIMLNGFRARDFLVLAAAERMTHSLMVPAMYNLCL